MNPLRPEWVPDDHGDGPTIRLVDTTDDTVVAELYLDEVGDVIEAAARVEVSA